MVFNNENIIRYIEDENQLFQLDADDLKSEVKKYKYSGVLQLLYARYLQHHKSPDFESQLEWCSVVVSDRKKVYELLFQPSLRKVIQSEVEQQEQSIEEQEKEKQVVPVEEETTLLQEENKVEDKELEELEEQIISEAIGSGFQIEDYEQLPEKETVEKEDDTLQETELQEFSEQPRTFLNWLEKPKTSNPKKKKSVPASKNKKIIIEDFLKGKKKPVKKKETFSPAELAKMSLVENRQFVTETLANIYAKQGKIDKAIEIYEQLSLKNPEKKTFFASRIRFLKEKQQYK